MIFHVFTTLFLVSNVISIPPPMLLSPRQGRLPSNGGAGPLPPAAAYRSIHPELNNRPREFLLRHNVEWALDKNPGAPELWWQKALDDPSHPDSKEIMIGGN